MVNIIYVSSAVAGLFQKTIAIVGIYFQRVDKRNSVI